MHNGRFLTGLVALLCIIISVSLIFTARICSVGDSFGNKVELKLHRSTCNVNGSKWNKFPTAHHAHHLNVRSPQQFHLLASIGQAHVAICEGENLQKWFLGVIFNVCITIATKLVAFQIHRECYNRTLNTSPSGWQWTLRVKFFIVAQIFTVFQVKSVKRMPSRKQKNLSNILDTTCISFLFSETFSPRS